MTVAMKTTIAFTLDSKSIENAIRELEAFKKDFEQKCVRLRQLIGERIAWSASHGFRSALVGDFVGRVERGGTVPVEPPPSNVQVSVRHDGDVTIVFADGEEAVFIEFGAGVYNNGAAGTSPHPWGAENGFLIGSYGKGFGRRRIWGYRNENGEVILTHGTPAAMPMYHGMMDAIRVMNDLVKEVFG